jgi:hypothetical protein
MARRAITFLPATALLLTSCLLVDLVMLPVKLIFGLFSAAGSAVGGLVSVSDVPPGSGEAPRVAAIAPDRWIVEGLRAEQPCTITCSAPGHQARVYAWPRDFANHGEEVTAVLVRKP